MGKPIVTTDIGNVSAFREFPQVRIVQTSDEFLHGLQHFINQVRDKIVIPRSGLPEEFLWRTKVDNIVEAIIQKQMG
jgi:hypothetical protein